MTTNPTCLPCTADRCDLCVGAPCTCTHTTPDEAAFRVTHQAADPTQGLTLSELAAFVDTCRIAGFPSGTGVRVHTSGLLPFGRRRIATITTTPERP